MSCSTFKDRDGRPCTVGMTIPAEPSTLYFSFKAGGLEMMAAKEDLIQKQLTLDWSQFALVTHYFLTNADLGVADPRPQVHELSLTRSCGSLATSSAPLKIIGSHVEVETDMSDNNSFAASWSAHGIVLDFDFPLSRGVREETWASDDEVTFLGIVPFELFGRVMALLIKTMGNEPDFQNQILQILRSCRKVPGWRPGGIRYSAELRPNNRF